jgi:apolipoprotein D and lipocalin family protein
MVRDRPHAHAPDKNCVAGTTDYIAGPNGELVDRDACRMGSPEGKQKVFQGPVSILNPGQNNKVTVRYTVYGFIPVSKTYWMLDHGDDYQWFIVSNPAFTNLSIFTRSPRPAPALVARLTARVQALGYNPKKLEYPEEFPSAAAAN